MPHHVPSCLTASYAPNINFLPSLKSDIEFLTYQEASTATLWSNKTPRLSEI